MSRKFDFFLKDILKEIALINKFTKGLTHNTFIKEEKTIYAVTRSLEIIGEAVGQLPKSITNKYPEIPWQEIKDMRNIIVHQYWGIDVNTEWDIISNELEELKKQILLILENENFS